MANSANVEVKAVVTAEDKASSVLKKFSGSIDSSKGAVDKFDDAVSNLAKKALLGVTVALGAATAAGFDFVNSFNKSEEVTAQLNAVLKSTGQAAGVTADQALELASSLQKVTKFSDEDVLSAENLLLTFTAIGKNIFPQTTKVALDMSQALGQDLKSSSIQLGKALQDPILGVTALRRVGVNFSDKQQDVIKSLVDTNQLAKAQALILQELQKEFGGSAEAAGKTFAGQLAILGNQIDDVKEKFGQAIVTAISPFVTKLAEFVQSDQFQQWAQGAAEKMVAFANSVGAFLSQHQEQILGFFRVLKDVIVGVIEGIKDLIGWFEKNQVAASLLGGGFGCPCSCIYRC
jgi:phage-related minor tail protein